MNADGELCQTPEESKETVKQYMSSVFHKNATFDQTVIDRIPLHPTPTHLDKCPSSDELELAIQTRQNGKSPGDDCVPAEVYRAIIGNKLLWQKFQDIICEFWKTSGYNPNVENVEAPSQIDFDSIDSIPSHWPIRFVQKIPY